ncbi:MAG: hypothetical protein AAFW74_15255 [Pseudomonadota bacterium]
MSVSAEHPLVGNDAASEDARDNAQNTVRAKHENEQLRPRSEDMSFAFRIEPPRADVQADPYDDGPIIRRIDGKPQVKPQIKSKFEPPRKRDRRDLRTPRLFTQQQGRGEAAPREELSASVPAMEESLLGDQTEEHNNRAAYNRRPGNMNFSVAAIRAQRMRKPAGTHKPTSILAKMAIATFVGITCISSGVTLGLYGPELGYQIERQARLASASLSGVLTWPGSDSSKPVQTTSAAVSQQQPATPKVATAAGYSKPAATTGAKRYYDRILPSKPRTTAEIERTAPPQAAAPTPATAATQAKLTGLEKYLAVPLDLQAARVNEGSTSTE